MASKRIVKQISPKLDLEIRRLKKSISNITGLPESEIKYTLASEILAWKSNRTTVQLSSQQLKEILGMCKKKWKL